VDIYRRWLEPEASDRHYLLVSRAATAGWALVACTVALYAARLGSLIEVVNRFGSFFYGSLLGVFVLAIGTKRATGTGAFVGLIAGCAPSPSSRSRIRPSPSSGTTSSASRW
jgi:Na+/proline symporter